MEITIALIVTAVTLVLGEITKVTSIPNKYIPIQNILIAIIASIICIVFKVENAEPLNIVLSCIFATMSAGGIADIKKVKREEK